MGSKIKEIILDGLGTQYKAPNHHLIPQTYMSAWANSLGTLLVKDLHTSENEKKNKEKFLGVNHYHSIIAGMPICTEDDAKEIFKILNNYDVTVCLLTHS